MNQRPNRAFENGRAGTQGAFGLRQWRRAVQRSRKHDLQMEPIGIVRSRFWLGVGFVAVIALGLASRKFPQLFPALFGKYPGDSLWALIVFLCWGFFKPNASTRSLAALAVATSCIVEFSQLYQAPWLNSIRSTTLGQLVFGSTFSWFDIVAYAIGVLVGALIDAFVLGAFGFSAGKRLTPRTTGQPSAAR